MTKAKAIANGATAELYDWQEAFTIKGDLREKDVTALERAAASLPHIILSATNSYAEAYLCAAIEAGWIVSPECSYEEVKRKDENGRMVTERRYTYDGRDVGDIHPGAVRWLGQQVIGRYNEVTVVPLAL